MQVERANMDDVDGLYALLYEVHDVHANGRPDLFKKGDRKYTKEEVKAILKDDSTPIYVIHDEDNRVIAHAFVQYKHREGIKTMYIDDICVTHTARRQGLCTALLNALEDIAKAENCHNMTLNVWTFNENAKRCYESFGMQVASYNMEKLI